jgi:DNA repair exonuclease SbcCD ATPase subunit
MIRATNLFSGGQDKLFSILFNLALSDVILERGTVFGFQVMDEVTDGLDKHNSNLIVNLIYSLCQKYKKQIFLITHRSDTRDLIQSLGCGKITVTMKNNVSTLNCEYSR